jgi:thiol peroxidase
MQERKNVITFLGNPLTLLGAEVQVGQKALDFEVLTNDLKKITLKDFAGKIKVVCCVPSLDTPVCDMEAKRFNEEASKFSSDVRVLFISMDLPFAQGRFCQSFKIDKVQTLSDHALASFGDNYGVLIKGLRLLTRAVFILDKNDVVRYVEYVSEITTHPDYEKALKSLKSLL